MDIRQKSIADNNKTSRYEILTVFVGVLILFAAAFPVIIQSRGIVLFPDEVGYWADAMTLAGEDWSGISLLFPWYSYGYSILLVPIIKLFKEPTAIYRAGLVLNLAMLEASYLMMTYLIRIYIGQFSWLPASLIALVAACNPTYLTYVVINLPETALLFCFTLTVLLLFSICDKPTAVKAATVGLLTVWLYTIHNRTVGIVVALVICMIILAIYKKLPVKDLVLFGVVLITGFILFLILKDHIVDSLWPNGIKSANEASDQGHKFKIALGSFRGFAKLVMLFFSQLGSVSISTLGLAPIGLASAACYAVRMIRQKRIPEAIPHLFVAAAFILSLGISSLFFIEPTRIDQLVYTRYVDTLSGVLTIMGLIRLSKIREPRSALAPLSVSVASIVTGLLCAATLRKEFSGLEHFNYVNATGLSRMYLVNGDDFTAYIPMVLMTALILIGFFYLGRKKSELTIILTTAMIVMFMIYNANPTVSWVVRRQDVYSASDAYLEEVRKSGKRVGYNSETDLEYLEYAAFRLYDVPISIIRDDQERTEEQSGEHFSTQYVILKAPVQE